jgi:hypothetical protein
MPTGIPFATTYTTVDVQFFSLASTGGITGALGDTDPMPSLATGVVGQMQRQGWNLNGLTASTTMSINSPWADTGSIHSLAVVITDFVGHAYIIFNPDLIDILTGLPEADPTGNLEGGLPVIGVAVHSGYTQTDIINAVIGSMNGHQPFWTVTGINIGGTFATFQDLLITANSGGPDLNNVLFTAGVLGGGSFLAPTSGGGWLVTSVPTPETGSTIQLEILTLPIINNFAVRSSLGGPEYLLNFKGNYVSIVMPYLWIFFNLNDGIPYTPRSIEEVASGGDNYWICCPQIPAAQVHDPIKPILNCAFEWRTNRTGLSESFTCTTAINNLSYTGPLDAFEVDVGIAFMVLNSMYHAAGPLLTNASKSITTASTIALSPGVNQPLAIVGSVWGMYIETQYWPLDTRATTTDGTHDIIALRSQTTPCEMTLWVAIS